MSTDSNRKYHLLWGTFCRRGIIDANTNGLTVVDIMPSLGMEVQIKAGKKEDMTILDTGLLAIVAVFQRTDFSKPDEEISEELNGFLKIGESQSSIGKIEVKLGKGYLSTFVVVAVEPPKIPVPVKLNENHATVLFELRDKKDEVVGSGIRMDLSIKVSEKK